MTAQWVNLFLLALAAGFLPWQFSAEILILGKEHGLRRATAFVAGITLWRFMLGIVLALVFAGGMAILQSGFTGFFDSVSAGLQAGEARIQARQGHVVDILLVVAGALLIGRAARVWSGHPDPDKPPSKLLTALNAIGPRGAFGVGIAWVAISVFQWTLLVAGVNQIIELPVGLGLKLLAYLLFLAIASLMIIAPIVFYAIQPARAQVRLAALESWLDRSMAYLGAIVVGGIGVYLILRGLGRFMG